VSVRTIVPAAPPAPEPAAEPRSAAPVAERPPRRPRPRLPAPTEGGGIPARLPEAGAGSHANEVGPETPSNALASEPGASAAVEVTNAASAAGAIAGAIADAASQPASDAGASAAAPGDLPPPVYPTRLPPAATIRYQVRRGFLRGDGEIRWQPAGDAYRLVLEARIAGLTLLFQTSEGAIDENGLAPLRFLDQRARRPPVAANFVRESARITFSGTAVEWPLFAGAQDRLSWMIQLAGIVAADPALLSDDARITMAVVGARGDAGVWSLRYVGRETVETTAGTVHAVKLVREGRSAYDTTAEIWLDPDRSYLPAHATLRNSTGTSEYDLLLDRVDP
jgi:hypothetical protein